MNELYFGVMIPMGIYDIKRNFTKFLIDRNGNISARFEPTNSMKKIKEKTKEVL